MVLKEPGRLAIMWGLILFLFSSEIVSGCDKILFNLLKQPYLYTDAFEYVNTYIIRGGINVI